MSSLKTQVKNFIVKVEQYGFYIFLIVLFLGLCPTIITHPVIFKNMSTYFLGFYSVLLVCGAPTVIAFLARWGRFENFDIFDRKLK